MTEPRVFPIYFKFFPCTVFDCWIRIRFSFLISYIRFLFHFMVNRLSEFRECSKSTDCQSQFTALQRWKKNCSSIKDLRFLIFQTFWIWSGRWAMILIWADLCTMDHDPDPTIVFSNSTWPMILISVVDSFGPWAGPYPWSGTGKAMPPPLWLFSVLG